MPKPAKSARDLKANAGKGETHTHTQIKEILKGEERRTHTDNVMTTKSSSGGLMSGLPRGDKSALLMRE